MANKIVVSTGDIPKKYEVLDAIFAIDSNEHGLVFGANASKAFDGVKEELRKSCKDAGGNAVIYCQFEYRNALVQGIIGKKQSIEIFAYGTAVKLLE